MFQVKNVFGKRLSAREIKKMNMKKVPKIEIAGLRYNFIIRYNSVFYLSSVKL